MRVRTFILFMALLAVLGLVTVQETARQTRVRYRLAELARTEERMKARVAALAAEEARLSEPRRLERLVTEHGLALVPLKSAPDGSGQ